MKQSRLDSREEITKLDNSNMLSSIEALPDQLEDAWEQVQALTFPDNYKDIGKIVVVGMGGSSLGSLIIKHLYKKELHVPLEVYRHYELPAYIDENTFVLISSNSGNTEEVLEAIEHAKKADAKIAIITNGGKLEELAKTNNYPIYKMLPDHNPSGEPRMATGYTVVGQLGMFSKLGLLNITREEITKTATGLRSMIAKLAPESTDSNVAKYLAYAAFQKLIVLVSSEHLLGATRVFHNQINENAKNLSAEHPLPEFNHHFMEGLMFPESLREDVIFFFFGSQDFHPRVQKRIPLTQALTENLGYQSELIQATAPSKLEQVFEIIMLGSYTTFYLGMLNGVNPGPVPNVEKFKQQL